MHYMVLLFHDSKTGNTRIQFSRITFKLLFIIKILDGKSKSSIKLT